MKKKLFCVFLVVLLLASSFADVAFATPAAVALELLPSLVCAFMASTGFSFAVSGMNTDDVNTQINTKLSEYAETLGQTVRNTFDFALKANPLTGGLIIPASGALALNQFINWLYSEEEMSADTPISVYASSASLSASGFDLNTYDLPIDGTSHEVLPNWFVTPGTYGGTIYKGSQRYRGYSFASSAPLSICRISFDTSLFPVVYFKVSWWEYNSSRQVWYLDEDGGNGTVYNYTFPSSVSLVSSSASSLTVTPSDVVGLPDITSETPADTNIEISTGYTGLDTSSVSSVLDAYMDALVENEATASATVENVETVDMTAADTGYLNPTTTDTQELGLPALGEALTSRFPFSIPWDVKRVFNLLNATPAAPCWEVDLYQWLRDDAPGLGNTTLRLDFSQSPYNKIGIVSRWTSSIGFCLALILGTKKLIWTS